MTLVTRLYVSNFIKQILTFYDNSNFVCFFLFPLKNRIGFFNFHFGFSISIYSPHFLPDYPHSHPDFPHSHPDSPHSHPNFPHSQSDSPHPTLIPHIPTLVPRIYIIPFIPFPDFPFRFLQIPFYYRFAKSKTKLEI